VPLGADPRAEETDADQDTPHTTPFLLVTRTHRLRLATTLAGAVATAVLGAGTLVSTAGPAAADAAAGGTKLPPGWELCVLQGVSAPVTQANVDDLDAWQAAEGGSTNNSASYNPFNTRRTTDLTGATIPSIDSGNGFPAFGSWPDGCAATVATLLQMNMWAITAALQAGTVAPPGAFLASVDQSKWCAPSAGTPCYADQILGATGDLAAALLGNSSALSVYGNVQSDLESYQQDITTTSTDKGVLTARNDELLADQLDLNAAQQKLAAAQRALQQFAIDTYVNGGTYSGTSFMNLAGPKPFGPQNANGVIAQQYENIVASDLDGQEQSASATVKSDQSHRNDAVKAVSLATTTLASDNEAETRALGRLVDDVATMQKAGACTTAVITVAAPGAPGPSPAAPGQPGSASPNSTTTTTTTTVPAAAATTTTTTTVPPTTTTTTTTTSTIPTTVPAVKVPPVTVPTSTTTTTVPSTTVPPTSTTTTTVAGSGSGSGSGSASNGATTATPQTANPAGLQVLQGCVSALAPPAGH
jgi:hypothetical protein